LDVAQSHRRVSPAYRGSLPPAIRHFSIGSAGTWDRWPIPRHQEGRKNVVGRCNELANDFLLRQINVLSAIAAIAAGTEEPRDRGASAGERAGLSAPPASRRVLQSVPLRSQNITKGPTMTSKQSAPGSFSTQSLGPFAPVTEYLVDAAQRSALFLDVMRQRGNQYHEHLAKVAPNVLEFAAELLVDGRTLERPVNYALVRIIPPQGVEIDPTR